MAPVLVIPRSQQLVVEELQDGWEQSEVDIQVM